MRARRLLCAHARRHGGGRARNGLPGTLRGYTFIHSRRQEWGFQVSEEIAGIGTMAFESGDVIFREGDETRGEAYMVHEGKVEVRRLIDGTERLLNTLGQGDLLGEVALFGEGSHSVTATALGHVVLLMLPAHRLENMVRTNPD